MARGHRLNTSIVLAAVHGLSGLFRAVFAVEPSLFRPLPTLSPSPIGHLASVDVKHQRKRRKEESYRGLFGSLLLRSCDVSRALLSLFVDSQSMFCLRRRKKEKKKKKLKILYFAFKAAPSIL